MYVFPKNDPFDFFTALACWNSGKFLLMTTRVPHAVSDTWVSDIRINLIIIDTTLTSCQKGSHLHIKIPWGPKIHIFGRPSLGRSYHLVCSLASRSMNSSGEEDFLKNNTFSLYMSFMAMPKNENACNLWLFVSQSNQN